MEILVVIGIIAVLAALLLAAVMKAYDAGHRTENFTLLGQVETGIGAFKQEFGVPCIPPGPFRLKAAYNGTEPELEFLLQCWPRLNTANTGLPNYDLDPNQTLLFFLTGGKVTNFTGFSSNPAQPFTIGQTGEKRRGPFLQMATKNYLPNPSNPILPGNPNVAGMQVTHTTTTLGGNAQPHVTQCNVNAQSWLVDAYGMPFVYFAAINGKSGMYYAPNLSVKTNFNANSTVQSYAITLTNGTTSTISPYYTKSTSGISYYNPQGFQLISAGKDGLFSAGGLFPPVSGEYGFDDQANFSKTQLGGGVN